MLMLVDFSTQCKMEIKNLKRDKILGVLDARLMGKLLLSFSQREQ